MRSCTMVRLPVCVSLSSRSIDLMTTAATLDLAAQRELLDAFTGGNHVACDLSLLRQLERVSRRTGDLETLNSILQRKAALLSGARAEVMLTIVNERLLICDDLDDPRGSSRCLGLRGMMEIRRGRLDVALKSFCVGHR